MYTVRPKPKVQQSCLNCARHYKRARLPSPEYGLVWASSEKTGAISMSSSSLLMINIQMYNIHIQPNCPSLNLQHSQDWALVVIHYMYTSTSRIWEPLATGLLIMEEVLEIIMMKRNSFEPVLSLFPKEEQKFSLIQSRYLQYWSWEAIHAWPPNNSIKWPVYMYS